MEETRDENKNVKKGSTSGGFFSLSIPAAIQKAFKRQSPQKDIPDYYDDATLSLIDMSTKRQTDEANKPSNSPVEITQNGLAWSSSRNSVNVQTLKSILKPPRISESNDLQKVNHSSETKLYEDKEDPNSALDQKTSLLKINDPLLHSTFSKSMEIHKRNTKSVLFKNAVKTNHYVAPDTLMGTLKKEEIIQNYIKACEKYKIKPLEKIIKQIRESDTSLPRIPRLDFRGHRMDYRSCECLEEIFKYLRVEWLNLSSTQLEDDGCVSICEMCEYYDTAKYICLNSNAKLGMRGWIVVSQLISKSTCLEVLDLSRTVFTEQTLILLTKAIKASSSLRSLHLEGCYLNGSRLQTLLSAVSSSSNIRELYLGENKIGVNDEKTFTGFFSINRHVRILDLRNNSLQDTGLVAFARALTLQNTQGLEALHLWNNYISSSGIKVFAEVLAIHPSLHTINFGKNKFGDEGVLHLKYALMQNNKLCRVGLSQCRISDTGVVALAEFVADSKVLLRLDIRENNIGLAGLIALSQALQVNYSVVKLDFNRHIKVPAGMVELSNRMIDDIRICSLRNRQLAKGGSMEEIMSLSSVLSDEHSITQSLKTLSPCILPRPTKSPDGSTTSFWQLLSKFSRAKASNPLSTRVPKLEKTEEIDNENEIKTESKEMNLAKNQRKGSIEGQENSILNTLDQNLENTQPEMNDSSLSTSKSEESTMISIKPINGIGRFTVTTVSSICEEGMNQASEPNDNLNDDNIIGDL